MRQELAALKVASGEPSATAIRKRLDAEPALQAIRSELMTKELQLAKRKSTAKDTHPLLWTAKMIVADLREQMAKREEELRGKVTAELNVEIQQGTKKRIKELQAQLDSVAKQVRPYCERALSNSKALLTMLRKRLASREAELRNEVTKELRTEAEQRAQDVRAQLAALEKRLKPDRERALAEARKSLASLKKQRAQLEQEANARATNELKKEATARAADLRDRLRSVEERTEKARKQQRGAVAQHLGHAKRTRIQEQLSEVDEQLASCTAREQALKEVRDKQEKNSQQMAQRAAELRDLEEDVRRHEEALRGVEQRLHELEVESRAPGYVTIASMATEPKAPVPYKAKRVKYGFVGVGMAVGLALLAVLLLDRRDDRIWSAEDVVVPGHVKILGCVPNWEREVPRLSGGPALLLCPGNGERSAVAEEMRNLIAGILHSNNGSPARTVLITGAGPGVGNTTVAANVAASVAGTGKRVLLVDANFRKPDVARVFELAQAPGLGDVLGHGTLGGDAIQATKIAGLSVLTAGSFQAGYLELLGSRTMAELLNRLREEYDFVFIDGPPLMLSDARMIAPVVEGVVCVFRAMTSRRATVRDCLETLEQLGARTIGVAVIGVPTRFNGYDTAVNALDAYASAGSVKWEAAGTPEE